ncbi:MAG: manganese efflux pump [Firmicutes bacterium]|nr:manganese efflux pump [Bacillota bacterium]
MIFNFLFFLNSSLLGVGLAMDAFSISLANGLHEPEMKNSRMVGISGVYALFQTIMPLAGWILVRRAAAYFSVLEQFIPWISLVLLCFIGGKMIVESIQERKAAKAEAEANAEGNAEVAAKAAAAQENVSRISLGTILLQGIATSIDALSVGFTIADYPLLQAMVCSLIIGLVTWVICFLGLTFGKKIGTYIGHFAGIFGGVLLIGIGIEIFITHLMG